MSGGPTLTSPQKTPTPTRGASTPANPGLSLGRAAIKDSLRGKHFDTQSAMLRPDQQGPGSKSGRGGANAKGSGGDAREKVSANVGATGATKGSERGGATEAKAASGPELRDMPTPTDANKTASDPKDASSVTSVASEAESAFNPLPFFAGRGGGTGEPQTVVEEKGEDSEILKEEEIRHSKNELENQQITLITEMNALGEKAHEMGEPLYFYSMGAMTQYYDRSQTMSVEEFRVYANKTANTDESVDDAWLEILVSYFPQWVMENCHILPEEGLKWMLANRKHHLFKVINQLKYGSQPPEGNWAAIGEGGKKAQEMVAPGKTAFAWAMFISAGCILGFGVSVGATFEIARGAATLLVSGIPDTKTGLKDVLADAWTPPPLTLATAGPVQRDTIKRYYLNDNALVHRYFNAMGKPVPHVVREKLGKAMRQIS